MEKTSQIRLANLDSDQIKLPPSAYPLQKRMVKLIFEAISKKRSLIIESPTGTGKTMCLLSATLEAVQQQGIKRVYYLTKTHTQMNGIIHEIKNTSYKPNFVVAQSKKALCAHTPAINQGAQLNIQQFNALCFQAKSSRPKARQIIQKCPLSTNIDQKKIDFPPFQSIRNQKDIKVYAHNKGYCPQRFQSALSSKAQLIIMPYIYMLNGFIFSHKNFNLEDCVFLFDEAHNILQMAEAQSSTMINEKIIEESRKQLSTLRVIAHSEMLSSPKGEDIKTKFQTIQDLEKYIYQLSSFKEELKRQYLKKGEDVLILSLADIRSLIKSTFKDFIRFRAINRERLQQLVINLKDMEEGKKKRFYISALINTCYKLDEMFNYAKSEYLNKYICVLYKQGKYREEKFKIKFHCMTSKPVFDRLNAFKSTFIFASGTLNVQDFKDTGLSFINYFTPKYPDENPYPNNNVETFVVSQYHRRAMQVDFKSPDYDMVAGYIKQVSPFIKNGILVFFKSYSYLTQFRKHLENNYVDLGRPTFFEERVMSDFQQEITKYKKAAAEEKGAIMFGCMRGKASEGCNFENQFARAVFIVGMPFSNINSIDSKIHDHMNDFQHWYNSNALLAVNQAIGRVVRHQKDYGLIFILGKKLSQFTNKLPQWLQYNKIHSNLSVLETTQTIKRFFSSKTGIVNEQLSDEVDQDEYMLNQQLLEMWNGDSENENDHEASSSFSKSKYYQKQKSMFSSPVSFQYPKPKPKYVKSQFESIKKEYVQNSIQIDPVSDEEEELQLLLALERSKKQM